MEQKNTATGGASAATATDASTKEVKQTIPYAESGKTFTTWLNRRISEHGNVRVPLGTKSARVNRLLADGRLEVEVPDDDGNTSQQQFVAFDEMMFDLMLPAVSKL